ncbi:exported hypothetical protein [Burkholderia vietnamiensis]|nr:exported hypothetical protein [Burkholderia vietnamiensis]
MLLSSIVLPVGAALAFAGAQTGGVAAFGRAIATSARFVAACGCGGGTISGVRGSTMR